MFTSYDKAIAALITPVISILVLAGLVPEDLASEATIAALTAVVTGLVTYLVPNKE